MIDSYYSFVYPHLIYGVEFWGHAPDYALEQMLICQKKALRIICLQPPNSTISFAFKNLKIMPVDILFKFRTLIFFHKHLLNDIELKQSLIINHNKNIQLNNQAFKLPKVTTEKGKRSVFYHTSELYDLLAWAWAYITTYNSQKIASCPPNQADNSKNKNSKKLKFIDKASKTETLDLCQLPLPICEIHKMINLPASVKIFKK